MQIKLTIQERLKDLRNERNLTLEQLADVLHRSRASGTESQEGKNHVL